MYNIVHRGYTSGGCPPVAWVHAAWQHVRWLNEGIRYGLLHSVTSALAHLPSRVLRSPQPLHCRCSAGRLRLQASASILPPLAEAGGHAPCPFEFYKNW